MNRKTLVILLIVLLVFGAGAAGARRGTDRQARGERYRSSPQVTIQEIAIDKSSIQQSPSPYPAPDATGPVEVLPRPPYPPPAETSAPYPAPYPYPLPTAAPVCPTAPPFDPNCG